MKLTTEQMVRKCFGAGGFYYAQRESHPMTVIGVRAYCRFLARCARRFVNMEQTEKNKKQSKMLAEILSGKSKYYEVGDDITFKGVKFRCVKGVK